MTLSRLRCLLIPDVTNIPAFWKSQGFVRFVFFFPLVLCHWCHPPMKSSSCSAGGSSCYPRSRTVPTECGYFIVLCEKQSWNKARGTNGDENNPQRLGASGHDRADGSHSVRKASTMLNCAARSPETLTSPVRKTLISFSSPETRIKLIF